MSRHRAYQNYDYENDIDEYDGDEYAEEEENELSPEDKVQMAEGTAEVRRVLASQAQMVTTQQIQEALWHYYYDVDKSVAYLINKFIDPAPKTAPTKAKVPPLKQNDSEYSPHPLFQSVGFSYPTGVSEADRWRDCATEQRPNSTTANFFADMPWMNIPEHRRTVLVAPPPACGGLLGGSSGGPKMSKLQALAAARKKKTQEVKKNDDLVILPKEVPTSGTKSTPPEDAPAAWSPPPAVEMPAVGRESAQEPHQDSRASKIQSGNVDSVSSAPRKRPHSTTLDGTVDDTPEIQKRTPSTFAQTLLPFASGTPLAYRRLYPLPWMVHTTMEALQEVFEKPSPDDVVLAAQSQAGRSASKGR